MSIFRRRLFPGTTSVAVGLVSGGICTYAFHIVAARAIGPEGYAPLAAVWFLGAAAGQGVFQPVEQDLARRIAAARASGQSWRHERARAAVVASVLAVAAIVALAAAWPVARRSLDNDARLAIALGGLIVGWAISYVVRGELAGRGAFGRYSVLMGGDAVVRLLAASAVAAVAGDVAHEAWPYAVILAVSPWLGVVLLPRRQVSVDVGGLVDERPRGMAALVLGSVVVQLLANLPPVALAIAGSVDDRSVSSFSAAFVIARAPLFLFAAVQATLVPRLVALEAEGVHDATVRILRRLVAVVTIAGGVACLGAALVGAPALELLYGEGFDARAGELVVLIAATTEQIVALTCAQALIASFDDRAALRAWLAGIGVFGIVLATAWPVDRGTVAWAYLAGAGTASVFAGAAVWLRWGRSTATRRLGSLP